MIIHSGRLRVLEQVTLSVSSAVDLQKIWNLSRRMFSLFLFGVGCVMDYKTLVKKVVKTNR